MSVKVVKRDGTKEDYSVDKIHKIIGWATDGIEGVSQSDIEMHSQLSIRDGITTKEIHEILIRSANDLISEESPNYQHVAARLLLYSLRKSVWGESEPPRLLEHIKNLVELKVYDDVVLKEYTESEIHKIGKFVKHKRDELFTYSGLQQLVDKYLIKNRKTGKVYETPQFAYILIAMTLFAKYPKDTRLGYIQKCYNYLSTFKISLPTPIMAGARTPIRQWSSCVLADCADTLPSIFSTATAIGYYTARRAGIGLNVGRLRAIGAPIRYGEVVHTGIIPFLKVFEATAKSCSQNGIRGGGATVYCPFFHYEIEDFVVLKNNGGSEENRVRKLDYAVQFSKLFYQRLINNQNITLFSNHECPDLYESFGTPQFDEVYERYEKDPKIKMRKVLPARELATLFSKERLETGRIYLMNVDNANQSPWIETVRMSNLCVHGDTYLLTSDGYYKIKEIEGKEVNVWNGVEWSRTTVQKTGKNQLLKSVLCNAGDQYNLLDCTDYHKWYLENGEEKRTCELKAGDKLIPVTFKDGTIINWTVVDIADMEGVHDTYCVTEPNRGMAVFNDILTGNCAEILQPTKPLQHIDDPDAEIGVCVLSAVNVLETKPEEFESVCDIIVRLLDEVIDLQDYPVKAAENFTKNRRSLGIGLTNFAAYLAKNKVKYEEEKSSQIMNELAEALQWSCLKASALLAKEKGVCAKFDKTKYSNKTYQLPVPNKEMDKFLSPPKKNWDEVWTLINEYGLRHSTVTAQMPCESTSVIQNSTNGIEPPRSYLSFKKSKCGLLKQIVPGYDKYGQYYTLAFSMKSNLGYQRIVGAMQRWIDMSISANAYYNHNNYEEGKIPYSEMVKDMINMYKFGFRTLYYTNSPDGDSEDSGCAGGACSV